MPIDPANITSYEQQTPQHIATTIVFEDPYSWVVLCEGGCMTQMRAAKHSYVQNDFSVLVRDVNDVTYRRIDMSDPTAVLCVACGPNGSNWHGWPFDKFTYGKLARELGIRDLTEQERFLRWARYEVATLDNPYRGRPNLSLYEVVTVAIAEHLREADKAGSLMNFMD